MMTPQEYLKVAAKQGAIMEQAQETINLAFHMAASCPVPENIRPATLEDAKPGAIFWYPRFPSTHPKWLIIDEMLHPGNRDVDFKLFISDSARYGLDGAFVEVDKTHQKRSL